MLRFPWYSWDLRWVTLKDLTLSLNVCTETRLWCILWCHWAHVCIIIMPLDPKDTPQLSQDDIILLFLLLEIHEKPLSWMCFWLWESGEKTEIPQNNKVVLCDLPLIMEVWLFFFFLHSITDSGGPWGVLPPTPNHCSLVNLADRPRTHVKWAEITVQWLTYTDAVVAELKYVRWATRRNLLTRLFSYLQAFESHKLVNHVLPICTSSSPPITFTTLFSSLWCGRGQPSWTARTQRSWLLLPGQASPLSGVFHFDVWSVSSFLNCIL